MAWTAWIYSSQFEFWSPQLHQHLRLHSTCHLNNRFTLTPISTLVCPAPVTGFTQPLQINIFITLYMLPFIPLCFLCTHLCSFCFSFTGSNTHEIYHCPDFRVWYMTWIKNPQDITALVSPGHLVNPTNPLEPSKKVIPAIHLAIILTNNGSVKNTKSYSHKILIHW